MRRVTLLVTAIGVVALLLLASGVALAATFDGTPAADTFAGTQATAQRRSGNRFA